MLRIIKYLLILALSVGLLFLLVFKPVDRSSYQDQGFYSQMNDAIDAVKIDTTARPLRVGWSRAAILPQTNLPIASYGIRPPNVGVHDTIYASVFAINNGAKQAYLVSLDLLIFPPSITQYLTDSLGKEAAAQVFLSASHTHNGPGGWMEGPAARFIAGEFDPGYVKLIGDSIIASMHRAVATMQYGTIKYDTAIADKFIKNRIISNDSRDTVAKYLIFETKETRRKAILNVYSAHATCISHKVNLISRDYPGELCDALEQNGFEMAAFMAGPVGSMGNECFNRDAFECTAMIGQDLANRVNDQVLITKQDKGVSLASINVGRIKLSLKDPSPRILENWSVRPWLYFLITSHQEPFISYLQLGEVLFLGAPCDFSGILSQEVYKKSAFEKILITSFNGSYVGYVTPDRYFDLDESETLEMNWLGYGAGAYLADLMVRLADHLKGK